MRSKQRKVEGGGVSRACPEWSRRIQPGGDARPSTTKSDSRLLAFSRLLTSNRVTMKSNRNPLVLALFLALSLTICILPAYGANKDIVELQTQVSQLQQQITQMKQSFDERMGVMRNLLEHNTDAANKVTAAINDLQTSINKQQQDRAAQVDQISGQM